MKIICCGGFIISLLNYLTSCKIIIMNIMCNCILTSLFTHVFYIYIRICYSRKLSKCDKDIVEHNTDLGVSKLQMYYMYIFFLNKNEVSLMIGS